MKDLLPILLCALAGPIVFSGCDRYYQTEMKQQAKVKDNAPDPFNPSIGAARLPLPGTVPMARSNPPHVLPPRLLGQDRYATFCTPCHGVTGQGEGLVISHGFGIKPLPFDSPRLRTAPLSYFRQVILHGYKSMYSFSDRLDQAEANAIARTIKTGDYRKSQKP
jgi:mono/diheme cytochrome c family protein